MDLSWASLPPASDPALAEWLEEASCSPHVKALADAAALVAEAEECMRGAGLWPWPGADTPEEPRS